MLVNLLLELNIINVQDIDRELVKLAATVSDPRAQKWIMRVAKHFIVNIDQLLASPYRAKAEKRPHFASKYNYDPAGGFKGRNIPEAAAPGADVEYFPTKSGEWHWRLVPKGTESAIAHGSAPDKKAAVKQARDAALDHGLGVRRARELEPGQEDPESVYTSGLHRPLVQRDIEQSFTPYSTKKAPKKELFGTPPPAEKAEPWVIQREKEQELHHFDPIQVRRRELWGRLQNVVDYMNWKHSLIAKKASEKQEDRDAARDAEFLFRRLETMATGDADGFRDIMREAQDFAGDVSMRPWIYTKDGKIIAQHENLTLRRALLVPTAKALTERPAAHGGIPVWCTNTECHASSYLRQGPLYFVDKNDQPYILIHFPSSQAKGTEGRSQPSITAEQADEIAPLFLNRTTFPSSTLEEVPTLAQAVEQLRANTGRIRA